MANHPCSGKENLSCGTMNRDASPDSSAWGPLEGNNRRRAKNNGYRSPTWGNISFLTQQLSSGSMPSRSVRPRLVKLPGPTTPRGTRLPNGPRNDRWKRTKMKTSDGVIKRHPQSVREQVCLGCHRTLRISRRGLGEPGKPPPGYKCKRCDGTDVSIRTNRMASVLTALRQHFITDCPERAKPPEGYVCRICDIVSAPQVSWDLGAYPGICSPVISSAIAQRNIHPVILVAKNLEKAMSAELAEVRSIIWKTASSRNKVGRNDLVGILRKRSLVCFLPRRYLHIHSLVWLADECWFCLSNPAIA